MKIKVIGDWGSDNKWYNMVKSLYASNSLSALHPDWPQLTNSTDYDVLLVLNRWQKPIQTDKPVFCISTEPWTDLSWYTNIQYIPRTTIPVPFCHMWENFTYKQAGDVYQRILQTEMHKNIPISIISSGRHQWRNKKIEELLDQYPHIPIWGHLWPKTSSVYPLIKEYVKEKADILLRSTYTIVIENSIHDGYASEKLHDAILSGAIPIYLGDPLAPQLYPDCILPYNTDLNSLPIPFTDNLLNRRFRFFFHLNPLLWIYEKLEKPIIQEAYTTHLNKIKSLSYFNSMYS